MALQENPSDQAAITAREAAANYYDQMEATLASSEYLAGRYGYADIAFYMAQFFGHRMGASIGDTHRRLIAWRQHVSNRQAVRQVIELMAAYLMSQGRGVPDWLRASIGLRPT